MLNRKLKVFLALFTALTLICTMSFATDEAILNVTNTTENTEAVENATSEIENTTSAEGVVPSEGTAQSAAQPKDGDVYKTGGDIELTEAINGNVFIKANNLTVKGQIGGDLFVLADKINLDGAQIYGNVFAIANEITVNGLIYDLYAACNTLNVPYNGTVYRDLKVVCQNATLNGVVGGNVNITASNGLTMENDAIVYKDLNYSSPSEIEIKEGAVQGSVNYKTMVESVNVSNDNKVSFSVWSIIYSLVFTLFIWLIVTFCAPKFKEKACLAGKNRPFASILFGLLGLVLIPICAFVLLLTIVGIPVSIVLIVLYFLTLMISMPIAIISIADMLGKKIAVLSKAKNLCGVILVALVIALLDLVPVVGGLISVILGLYGFGIVILAIFNKVTKKEKIADKKEESNEAEKIEKVEENKEVKEIKEENNDTSDNNDSND